MTDETAAPKQRLRRRWLLRYAILSAVLFVPLAVAFILGRQAYPIAIWLVMNDSRMAEHGRTYYVLRGETLAGHTIDIPATSLTDAMASRMWTMVGATAQNASFLLAEPHPDNARMLAAAGGVEGLPSGARLPDLLRAWGQIYNERLPAVSDLRLRAIRLDTYQWEGGYANFDRYVSTCRVEL